MKIEAVLKITLTSEELKAVKIVHNMLANLSVGERDDLNHELPLGVYLSGVQDSLAIIYALANNNDISELDEIKGE